MSDMPREPSGATGRLWNDLLTRVREVHAEAVTLSGLAPARTVAVRVDQAFARLDCAEAGNRPLLVTLLGGTQVGKSKLFSALLGRPDASPSSDGVAGFTRVPHIAAFPSDGALLLLPELHLPNYVEGLAPGVVVCDAADIDSVEDQNRAATLAILEVSDVVVYVTDSQKMANYHMVRQVRNWANRKRWYFALNKADRDAARLGATRDAFDAALRGLGFEPDDRVRFVVSACEPERYDLPRLRAALTTAATEGRTRLTQLDGFFGSCRHALTTDPLDSIARTVSELNACECRLMKKVQAAYEKGLSDEKAVEAFRLVALQAAWRALAPRAGAPMAPAVWLRCRFSSLLAGYQVTRLLRTGPTALGVAGAAVAASAAFARGLAPLRHVASSLGANYRNVTRDVEADARCALAAHGLDGLAGDPRHSGGPTVADGLPPALAPLVRPVEHAIRTMVFGDAGAEVLGRLAADVEQVGLKAARATVAGFQGRLTVVLANAPPLAMGLWVLARMGEAWWAERYLTFEFYGMAAALLAASVVPGLILFGLRLRSTLQGPVGGPEQPIDEPESVSPLRAVRRRLEHFLERARSLRSALDSARRTLDREGVSGSIVTAADGDKAKVES